MKTKQVVTQKQAYLGVMLKDQTLFMRHFWKADMSLPPSTRQKAFFNDNSRRKFLSTGRKTAKSLCEEATVVRFSIDHHTTGGAIEECMFTTPGENQISPIWDRLISRIESNPLFRLFCKSHPKNEGKLEWHTGVIWYFRIDGSSGTDANMIGLRCKYIIGDEQALTVRVCHMSRMQAALPDCRWLYGGVPNGVRHSIFWEIDQTATGADWSRHKFSTLVNPLYWAKKVLDALKRDYVEGSQGYITQVMGGWGEEVFSSFPPGNLAIDPKLPYSLTGLTASDLPNSMTELDRAMLFARCKVPRLNVYQYAIGMDYGFLQDPTQVVIGWREKVGDITWKTCARIELVNCDPKAQARFLNLLAEGLGHRLASDVCLDQASGGLAVAMDLLNDPLYGQWWQNHLLDYNAGGTIEVEMITPETKAALEEEGALVPAQRKKVRRKQYATQLLQFALICAKNDLVSSELKLWLAKDTVMEQELIDTSEKKTANGYVVYYPRLEGSSRPQDHITDALRTLVLACLAAQAREEGEEGDETEYADLDLFRGEVQSAEDTVKLAWRSAGL